MKILICDDERMVLEEMLYNVKQAVPEAITETFNDPLEALAAVKDFVPDVAFLDIEMYGISGLDLAKRLKDLSPKTNIIFVTGFSKYAIDAFELRASGYIIKPATTDRIRNELANLRFTLDRGESSSKLYVRTFGEFGLFHRGKELTFARNKSKELFAYLVDRQGVSVTMKQISAVVFEDAEDEQKAQKYIRALILDIRQTLASAGVGDVLIKGFNSLAIDPAKIECDYYEFLSGNIKAINSYHGEYMAAYSWAEFTTGILNQKILR